MFKYIVGDILESDAACLINTVNCEGFMGKGIAYQFKKKFPLNNKDYMAACRSKRLYIGTLHVFYEDGKTIINFPTKDRWREKSKIEYIHIGMKKLIEFLEENSISSVAIPPLGCGNGGLKWSEVKPIILSYLTPLKDKIDFQIYEPGIFKKSNSVKSPTKPTLSHIILMEMKIQLNTKRKLELQKGAYFFNLLSHDEFFKFQKYKYGPYSHSIDIISRRIKESQDYYRMDTNQYVDFCKKQLISKSVEKKLLKYEPYIKKSTDIINAFADSYEVELAATICFLLEKQSMSAKEVIYEVREWSEHKAKTFSSRNIYDMLDKLYVMHILSKNLIEQYELSI